VTELLDSTLQNNDVLSSTDNIQSLPRVNTSAADAVLSALAYADLFDYPLSLDEVTRFQVGTRLSHAEVGGQLALLQADGLIMVRDGHSPKGTLYCLAGREATFEIRHSRELESQQVWQRARRYFPILTRIPYVRMVAVTGALAVNNIDDRPDIDLLVLAEPGRVWLCRRFLVALVRVARLFSDDLCPNYILSTSKLALDQRDFFTAHELAQMVPVFGAPLYRAMLRDNSWAVDFLPRAFDGGAPVARRAQRPSYNGRKRPLVRIVERLLSLSLFDAWERWEMLRLKRKLSTEVGEAAEVICTPEQCKGHTGLHRHNILARFKLRLAELGLATRIHDA
jgi:hypothetical protein